MLPTVVGFCCETSVGKLNVHLHKTQLITEFNFLQSTYPINLFIKYAEGKR